MLYMGHYPSPLGLLRIAIEGDAVTGLWIKDQTYDLATIQGMDWERMEDHPLIEITRDWLDRYFKGERPEPSELPLAPKGSEFRQMVWEILKQIPYGSVTTYGAIAKQVGDKLNKKMSAQAVGGAVGHNPIGIIIPCHRVIGSDGSLTGYAGGLDAKRYLLRLEGRLDQRDKII